MVCFNSGVGGLLRSTTYYEVSVHLSPEKKSEVRRIPNSITYVAYVFRLVFFRYIYDLLRRGRDLHTSSVRGKKTELDLA